MSIPTRILILLIGLRLLLPPGICVCKLSTPAAVAVARVVGGNLPAPVPEDHDDHHPGCPASVLSLGLGLKPAPPVLDAPAIVFFAPMPSLPVSSSIVNLDGRVAEPFSFDPLPLHVCHCVFLI